MLIFLRFAHSFCCNFFNIVPRLEPVGTIFRPPNSGFGDNDGPQFISCVEKRHPEVHELWIFGEAGVTPKFHLTARLDVGAFVGDYCATNYLTPSWSRVPMFIIKSINGSAKWLGGPSFLWNYGLPWTLNLLDPYADWGSRRSSTSQNSSSEYGGYSDSFFINWNQPACFLSIFHQIFFENICSAARRACDNLLMDNRTYRMQIPSTCHNPICGCLVNWRDDALDDC